MTEPSKTPERIYLQPGFGNEGETTWCSDKTGFDDVEYVRADVASGALSESVDSHNKLAVDYEKLQYSYGEVCQDRDSFAGEVALERQKVFRVEAYAGACRSAGFELTAALAQMEPWSEDDISTEYLNRERVMQLVMDWRRKVDAASAAQSAFAASQTILSQGQSPNEAQDALRWRWWLANGMHVARAVEGDWTCWVYLPCVPFRSQTTDPNELTDALLARFPLDGGRSHAQNSIRKEGD